MRRLYGGIADVLRPANLRVRMFLGFRFLVEQGSSSFGLIFTVAFLGFSSGTFVPNFFLLRCRGRFM